MPSADEFLHQRIAALLALRQAHDRGNVEPSHTLAEMVATIRPILADAPHRGIAGGDARAIAMTLAQLADFWAERFCHSDGDDPESRRRQDSERAFWRSHRVADELFGHNDDSPHFSAHIESLRPNAHLTTVHAWAAALALGCRGPLRPAETTRLWAQLVPEEPLHVLPASLLVPGGRLPADRRAKGRWLVGGWLSGCALATALLWMTARAELAGVVGSA